MTHKLLLALDSSEGAWRAVEYVAQSFGKAQGVEVTLCHVLAGLPPVLWDDGHILQDKEREARERLKAEWKKEQEKNWDELVDRARQHLTAAGFPKGTVTSEFKTKYFDVAEDLVNEAVTGGYRTIVMGRRGLGTAKSLLLGSVTNKVVQNSRGCAVIVVP